MSLSLPDFLNAQNKPTLQTQLADMTRRLAAASRLKTRAYSFGFRVGVEPSRAVGADLHLPLALRKKLGA
eukprot:5348929-Alexandrium_andersonii.AAC.1